MSLRSTSLLGSNNLIEKKMFLGMGARESMAKGTGPGSSDCSCVHTISPRWLKTEMPAGLRASEREVLWLWGDAEKVDTRKGSTGICHLLISLFRSLFPGSSGTLFGGPSQTTNGIGIRPQHACFLPTRTLTLLMVLCVCSSVLPGFEYKTLATRLA